MVEELPALGYIYNYVCNDVACAGMPVEELKTAKNSKSLCGGDIAWPEPELRCHFQLWQK